MLRSIYIHKVGDCLQSLGAYSLHRLTEFKKDGVVLAGIRGKSFTLIAGDRRWIKYDALYRGVAVLCGATGIQVSSRR
jgi:hypothetical protein